MKKVLSLLLIMSLLFVLTSCGNASPAPTGNSATQKPDNFVEEVNTNYFSSYGRIVHYSGYTYFVQPGTANNGNENGDVDSENIYRIADGANEAEMIAVIPSTFAYGSAQLSVYGLAPCGDDIYFLKTTFEDNAYITYLYRVNTKNASVENLKLSVETNRLFRYNSYNRIKDKLYLCKSSYKETDAGARIVYQWYEVDLRTAKINEFNPELNLAAGESARIITVSSEVNGDGCYVYYVKYNTTTYIF